MSGFNEDDHPRDEEGKISTGESDSSNALDGEIAATPGKSVSEYIAASGGDIVAGVREFYRKELQNKPVKVSMGELGEQEVHCTGEGWEKIRHDLRKAPLKAEIVGRVREVLEKGEYLGARPPHKPSSKHGDVVAYHYFRKAMNTSQGRKEVIIDVTERPGNCFEYRLYTGNYEGFKGVERKRRWERVNHQPILIRFFARHGIHSICVLRTIFLHRKRLMVYFGGIRNYPLLVV